jgi:enoyl-CoA hydratase
MSDPVLYEETDGIAIITLNRPEKRNALNEDVIEGIAQGIDAATGSAGVAAVVLRGAGGTLTAGYDLSPGDDGPAWATPYAAAGPKPRAGAWDPVRDYQFMGNNARRFMKIWECPKPVLGEITGWAVGGATDLVLCCDQLYMASDAHIGYAPSRIYGTPTTMMWVHRLGLEHAKQFLLTGRAIDALNKMLINQAYENMGLRTTQMLGTFFDGIARHTEEAYRWEEDIAERGLKAVVADRDGPWNDYSQRPKPENS